MIIALKARLAATLIVRDEQRPGGHKQQALELIRCIYGDLSSTWLWRTPRASGVREPSPLHKDLLALADVIDCQAVSCDNVFWNRVAHGSYEADVLGLGVGTKIYQTHEECCDRVVVVALNIMSNRAWVDAAVSRWTGVATTIIRFLVGSLIGQALPRALDDIRLNWQLDESMESSLAALVKADSEDFSSRNKLRLIRLCKVWPIRTLLCLWPVRLSVAASSSCCNTSYSATRGDRFSSC